MPLEFWQIYIRIGAGGLSSLSCHAQTARICCCAGWRLELRFTRPRSVRHGDDQLHKIPSKLPFLYCGRRCRVNGKVIRQKEEGRPKLFGLPLSIIAWYKIPRIRGTCRLRPWRCRDGQSLCRPDRISNRPPPVRLHPFLPGSLAD